MERQELIELFHSVNPEFMNRVNAEAKKVRGESSTSVVPSTIKIPENLAIELNAYPIVVKKKSCRGVRNAT